MAGNMLASFVDFEFATGTLFGILIGVAGAYVRTTVGRRRKDLAGSPATESAAVAQITPPPIEESRPVIAAITPPPVAVTSHGEVDQRLQPSSGSPGLPDEPDVPLEHAVRRAEAAEVVAIPEPAPTMATMTTAVAVGRHGIGPLHTFADIDLGLVRSRDTWVLSPFDLAGAEVHLGPVRARLASLPVTARTQRLTTRRPGGPVLDEIDLSEYAVEPALLGGAASAVRGQSRGRGLVSVEEGIAHVVAIDPRYRRRSEALLVELDAHRALWTGDAETYAGLLLLDLQAGLDLWPSLPEGVHLGVGVVGPGSDGTVWAAAGDIFGSVVNDRVEFESLVGAVLAVIPAV